MIVCDKCGKRNPRREIKVKDVQFDKPKAKGRQFDLCETCYQAIFKTLIANHAQ